MLNAKQLNLDLEKKVLNVNTHTLFFQKQIVLEDFAI